MSASQAQKQMLNDNVHWAIEELSSKGYKIHSNLSFGIDPNLKIMGYTIQSEKGQTIVVSAWSLSTLMLKGLLIHELCHVIRAEEKHPSHDYSLQDEIVNNYASENNLDDKTARLLMESMQQVQDIYADDIGFLVFKDTMDKKVIIDFFENWASSSTDSKAPNQIIGVLIANAFSIASLKRRGYGIDAETSIRRKNSLFLKHSFEVTNVEQALKIFSRLVDFLTNLPRSTSSESFKTDMKRYFDLLISWPF
ncbi:MAG: DUF5781 family protein [Nitrososphaerales archaeon]